MVIESWNPVPRLLIVGASDLSIVAEIIAARSARTGAPLATTTGRISG